VQLRRVLKYVTLPQKKKSEATLLALGSKLSAFFEPKGEK